MSFFKRIFKVGQAEAHALVDKLEDPIKMTEQGIRDMKKDLDASLQALAEVKAMAIRSRKEVNDYKSQSQSYEHKAMQLLQNAQAGNMDAGEADRLAAECLTKKEDAEKNAVRSETDLQTFEKNISQLDANVKKLRSTISHYENELKTLKARAKVSNATKKINKSMSGIDSSSTISMLEKMKTKVEEQEALADAYGDIASENKTLDDEIDSALSSNAGAKSSLALAELKAKMAAGK